MVTVPVLIDVSGLNGSNLPPSAFSESPSGGAAAHDAHATVKRIAAVPARNLNRLMFIPPKRSVAVDYCSNHLRSAAKPAGTCERPNPTRKQLSGTGPS